MKVLNIYLTQIYNHMVEQGFFEPQNPLHGENYKYFIKFSGDLGYPEFGIVEGIRTGDFSHLPNSDLIDFDDLNPNVLLDLPTSVKNFVKKEIPDLHHQIQVTLSQKALTNNDTRVFINRLTDYIRFLNEAKKRPIQRDYDFLNYVISFASKPSVFNAFMSQVEKDSELKLTQWQILLEELIVFSEDFEFCKKFAAQIILGTTKYEYSEQLQSAVRGTSWKGFLPVKFIKNILSDSSFVEIGASLTYFSVKENDLLNVLAFQKFKDLMPRIRVIFPEIESVCFSSDQFYQRKLMTIVYGGFTDMRKKTFSSLLSYIINKSNSEFSADKINDSFFNSIDSFLSINEMFEKNGTAFDGKDSNNDFGKL